MGYTWTSGCTKADTISSWSERGATVSLHRSFWRMSAISHSTLAAALPEAEGATEAWLELAEFGSANKFPDGNGEIGSVSHQSSDDDRFEPTSRNNESSIDTTTSSVPVCFEVVSHALTTWASGR